MSTELDVAIQVQHPGGAFTLDVAMTARPGITCVLGRSGSGKTTLLGAIAGLVRPASGRIALGMTPWFDAGKLDVPARHRHVAYVFQGLALFPHMSAVGNVMYGMPRSVPRADRVVKAVELLKKLEVGHLAWRRPRTFSGGEAQRVALARALAMQPRVILLDEPFSALDRELRVQLARLVRALVDELAVPLLFVTHNIGEARALGDHVIRLADGKIVEEGPPSKVLPRIAAGAVDGAVDEETPMPELRTGR